ncbi:MAG TPA: DoxX family protein [Edaphobacter sp.]|nr:DoxX family protein [Edaphobacter sp.]
MKKKTITYWIATVFVACIMTASGVLAISHAPPFMKALAHLGYPPYFSNLLGFGKLIGVCVLLAPGLAKLKEWAYVAFGITVLSACYSHFNSGDGLLALEPLITFAALVVSYLTRPAIRTCRNPVAVKAQV